MEADDDNNNDVDDVELLDEFHADFVNRITADELTIYSRDHGIKEPTLDDLNQAKHLKKTLDTKKFNSHLLVFVAVIETQRSYGFVLRCFR
jgi:hypothetical protein